MRNQFFEVKSLWAEPAIDDWLGVRRARFEHLLCSSEGLHLLRGLGFD